MDLQQMDWRGYMEATYPEMIDDIRDMHHWAKSWSTVELLENDIVELVGDQASCYTEDDQIWSDFCMIAYDWWGCLDLASGTPEWDQFWSRKLSEETE